MKVCPVCGRLYGEGDFCQADGQPLDKPSRVPPRSDEEDGRVGQLMLERYLVFRVVADGGMGRVYEALDQQAQRQVALKVLHTDVARDSVSVERFKREYEVSRQLPHDHIVEVLDFKATKDATYVLVMEFLGGETLRATLKRERALAPGRAIRLVSQLALALDPAHDLGLVHRDLKPDNVFLCQTVDGDVVKVLDFGSVKQRGADKQLTIMGTTIGSPFYMSPEQAQGLSTLDRRADVWAVNALMYEVLTAALPFTAPTAPAILLQILSGVPKPPSQVASTLPLALDAVMSRAFDKDPQLRTGTVGDLADELGQAFGLQGTHADWARATEAELEARVCPPDTGARADVAESFFVGRSGALSPAARKSRSMLGWALLGLLLAVTVVLGYLVSGR
jgi:serine/threonine-protein kinase